MNVDFLHNQIIRDTISQKFIESFNENLLPYLVDEYGDSLEEVQLYEDHLASGFRVGGEFHYPLTLVVDGRALTRWVKWQVANYRYFDKFNPYTYKGAELLEFTLLDDVPRDMKALVAGRPIYDDATSMPVFVTSSAEDKTFLAGKYSQGFIDVMTRAITEQIEDTFSVDGLSDSGVVLEVRFEPGTFMEHPVGNTTYRRLLIKARGCGARDLWIKWTRLDECGIYTVSDNVATDDISFAIADDVPGKIREREYRYLAADDVKKYQTAMSRKNVTEWRDMMRRVIRRGEVSLRDVDEASTVEERVSVAEPKRVYQSPVKHTAPPDMKEERDALDAILSGIDVDDEPQEDINDDLAALLKTAIGITDSSDEAVEPADDAFEAVVEEIASEKSEGEPVLVTAAVNEATLREELERKIRAELEAELAQKNKEAEELRSRLEAQLRAELREKELLAEAARAAIIEQERLAKQREAEEAAARAEAARREEAERRAAEEARLAEQRAAEQARIKAELEAQERARRAAEEARLEAEKANAEIKYVSKTAKLIFRGNVDSSITKRIHEIILATIKYYHKEDVYIKIKATVPDNSTVNLEFVKIPENELQLLVNIIKVLGRSDLGITKALLD